MSASDLVFGDFGQSERSLQEMERLRQLVSERLAAAVDDILDMFGRTVAQYQEQIDLLQGHRQLDSMTTHHEEKWHIADPLQPPTWIKHLRTEDQSLADRQALGLELEQTDRQADRQLEQTDQSLCRRLWAPSGSHLMTNPPASQTNTAPPLGPRPHDKEAEMEANNQLEQTDSVDDRAAGTIKTEADDAPSLLLSERDETDDSDEWTDAIGQQGLKRAGSDQLSDAMGLQGIKRAGPDKWMDATGQRGLNTAGADEWTDASDQRGLKRVGPARGVFLSPELIQDQPPLTHPPPGHCCQVCGEAFTQRSHLLRHAAIHGTDCGVCGKHLELTESLKLHLRCHQEASLRCGVCGQSFTLRGNLRTHLRIHSGERPHGCSVCGKSFGRRATLVRHVRSHTGEKPFSCSFCGRGFVEKGNLTVHLRTHTGERPYRCSTCDRRFTQLSCYYKHPCQRNASTDS